jgi:hypothetical protein
VRRCRRRWRALPGGLLRLVVEQPGLGEELTGALTGLGGDRTLLVLILGDQFAAAARPAAYRAAACASSAIRGTYFWNYQDQQNSFLEIVDTQSQAAHRGNATALVRGQDPSTQAASGLSRALEYNVAF